MAGHFASVVVLLIVGIAGRGALEHGTPQPEQIHISSTGGQIECIAVYCLTLLGCVTS